MEKKQLSQCLEQSQRDHRPQDLPGEAVPEQEVAPGSPGHIGRPTHAHPRAVQDSCAPKYPEPRRKGQRSNLVEDVKLYARHGQAPYSS